MRVPFSPLFTTKPESEDGTPDKELDLLRTVVHCIELAAGPIASTKIMVWWEDDDCRFPAIMDDTGATRRDLGRPVKETQPLCVDEQLTRCLFKNYQNFLNGRGVIDMALFRLAAARSGWSLEERAIDLGIALEVMLMYDGSTGRRDNNEISHKLGVRAAWLVGQSPSERVAIFKQIRKIYDHRSSVAHSGEIKHNCETWRVRDDEIEQGIILGGNIVKAALTRGDWPPDWTGLVLGATPTPPKPR